jgi:hypothetical protein
MQATKRTKIKLGFNEVLIHNGMEIDREVLDAIVNTNKRLLWAFIRNRSGDIRAVPYSESHVIWLAESDVLQERDVEI